MKKNRNAERRRRENRGAEGAVHRGAKGAEDRGAVGAVHRGAEGAEDRGAVGAEDRGAEGAEGVGCGEGCPPAGCPPVSAMTRSNVGYNGAVRADAMDWCGNKFSDFRENLSFKTATDTCVYATTAI